MSTRSCSGPACSLSVTNLWLTLVCVVVRHGRRWARSGRFLRSRQDGLVVTCYAAEAQGENGEPYRDLQKVPAEEPDLRDAVSRWDAKLKGHGVSKPLLSVGRHEIELTAL